MLLVLPDTCVLRLISADEIHHQRCFNMNELISRSPNWKLCCLCQEEKAGSDLRHPYTSEQFHDAYYALEHDLEQFRKNQIEIPLGVDPTSFDDGHGTAATLLQNKAIYHHNCRTQFRSHVVERALTKRKREEKENVLPSGLQKKTRSSRILTSDPSCQKCVCCEKGESRSESLHCSVGEGQKNLVFWAAESQDWDVHARLTCRNESSAIYYHLPCYLKLKRAGEHKENTRFHVKNEYDPLALGHGSADCLHKKQSQTPKNVLSQKDLCRQVAVGCITICWPENTFKQVQRSRLDEIGTALVSTSGRKGCFHFTSESHRRSLVRVVSFRNRS